MSELLTQNPWLVVIALAAGVIVACVAIVFITDYLRQSQQAEIDASLKHDMLNRGMSAADIKTVLEASTDGEAKRLAARRQQSGGAGRAGKIPGRGRRRRQADPAGRIARGTRLTRTGSPPSGLQRGFWPAKFTRPQSLTKLLDTGGTSPAPWRSHLDDWLLTRAGWG